jgi:uncharacterized membrane protein YgcG
MAKHHPDDAIDRNASGAARAGFARIMRRCVCVGLLVLSCGLGLTLRPAAAAERILNFVSDVTVQRNGDLLVAETIVVNAEGDKIRRGILRDFPTIYSGGDGRRVEVGFEVQSVMLDGMTESYATEKLANGVRVRIGRADVLVSNGTHEYVIKYRTTRQIGYFDEFDELYWNATGTGWTFPIDAAEARITLPEAVPFRQKAFYTGQQGSTRHDAAVVEETPGRIVFRTTQPLPAFAGLTVAAGWQKGVLTPPPGPGLIERAGEWIHRVIVESWIFQHLPQVLAGIGLPLVLAYYAYAWFRIGGAPRRGTVIPLFTPPEGLSAAATRYVRRMDFDGKTFTAALLELAVNGHLKLVESKKTITIEQRTGGKPVGDAEQTAEFRLFHSEQKVTLTQSSALELRSAMNGLQSVFKKHYDNVTFSANTASAVYGLLACFGLMAAVVAANWTQDSDLFSSTLFVLLFPVPAMMAGLVLLANALRCQGVDKLRGLIFGLPFAIGGGYFGLWILFAYRQDWIEVLPSAVAFALAPVAVFAFPLFRMPTQAGRKMIDAIEGFRMYLGVAEEDRLQAFYPPKKTPELFERYLPYAVALDVENAWAKRFEGVLKNAELEQNETVWYMGDGSRRRDPAMLTEFVSKSLSERIASSATAPGTSGSRSGSSHDSSSSGSSGSGSSGGGGGGGGGSGW